MAKSDTLRYIKNAKDAGLTRLRKWYEAEQTRIGNTCKSEVDVLTKRLRVKLAAPVATIVKILQAAGVAPYKGYSQDESTASTAKMVEKVINSIIGFWQIGPECYKAETAARKELAGRFDELSQELTTISMKAEQAVLLTGVGDDLKAALKELDVFLAKIR